MRFFLYGSLIALLAAGCGNPYSKLKEAKVSKQLSKVYQPDLSKKKVYRATVDGRFLFKKFHLSGVLLLKNLADSSTRAVFQNEMGYAFFHFKWDRNDSFSVISILPQLNKPAIIRTLQKDFSMLLLKGLPDVADEVLLDGAEVLYQICMTKGRVYYITEGAALRRIENWGRKKVTTLYLARQEQLSSLPDSVLIKHHTAHFTIQLSTIKNDEQPAE